MGMRGRLNSDRTRTIWTPEMDRYFIDLMLEQVDKGNKGVDNLFTRRAWKHMMSSFIAKFRFQYDKDVLKNRHKTLRNLYRAVRILLGHKGFSWDETRKMVTADNKVWDEYIKVHPDARSYRIKTIPYYSDLRVIYENSTSEGKSHSTRQTNSDRKPSGSETDDMLLEGSESPATSVDDGEACGNLVESPSHDITTAEIAKPISVREGSGVALHEIMVDQDYDISASRETMDDTPDRVMDCGSAMCTRTRTYWQPPMDRYFIDLMLDHVQKGNQVDGLFHKQAWTEMIESFNAKFGFKYDVEILKNRYKTLRRQYNVITHLLGLDGFVWDETRQMVAADDRVWQDYIKGHKDARQYMTRPVPYFKDLCAICGELGGDGRPVVSSRNGDKQVGLPKFGFGRALKRCRSSAASYSSEDQVGDDVNESSHAGFISTESDQKLKHQLENPANSAHSKKPKIKDEEGMANALREMVASAVFSLTDKEEKNVISISVENVIGAIQALPDMDEDLVLDACDFLEDEKKAKTFLALDVKLRKKWLLRKLRPQQ